MDTKNKPASAGSDELEAIARATPFSTEELSGQEFSRGKMLGASVPGMEAADET